MTNQDLIFASLMGINNYKTFERLNLVQDEMSKKVIPRAPFLPFQNKDLIVQQQYEKSLIENNFIHEIAPERQFFKCGFSFRNSNVIWYFPYEPLISISGGTDVQKANVSKVGVDDKGIDLSGTMKTRTRPKDFEIIITGMLFGQQEKGTPEDCFPKDNMVQLMSFLTNINELNIFHFQLEALGILHVVIEDYKFPFTKGENMQAFEIRAISDYPHSLIVKNQ